MSRSLKGSLLSLEDYYRSNPHVSPSWSTGTKPFKPLLVQEKKAKKNRPARVSKSEFVRLQLDEWLRPTMEQMASFVQARSVSAELLRARVHETVKESSEEVMKVSSKVSSKVSNKESSNESSNESSKVSNKESSKESNKESNKPMNSQLIPQEPERREAKEEKTPSDKETRPVDAKNTQQHSSEPEKKQLSSSQRKESLKARLKRNPLLRFMCPVCLTASNDSHQHDNTKPPYTSLTNTHIDPINPLLIGICGARAC